MVFLKDDFGGFARICLFVPQLFEVVKSLYKTYVDKVNRRESTNDMRREKQISPGQKHNIRLQKAD